jgi:hypothetical protein
MEYTSIERAELHPEAIARACHVAVSTAKQWRQSGIPRRHQATIAKLVARSHGRLLADAAAILAELGHVELAAQVAEVAKG